MMFTDTKFGFIVANSIRKSTQLAYVELRKSGLYVHEKPLKKGRGRSLKTGSLDFDLPQKFAKVGGIHTQVIGDVFVRDELQEVWAPRHQGPKALFGGIGL